VWWKLPHLLNVYPAQISLFSRSSFLFATQVFRRFVPFYVGCDGTTV
jgi:hypothetical protein